MAARQRPQVRIDPELATRARAMAIELSPKIGDLVDVSTVVRVALRRGLPMVEEEAVRDEMRAARRRVA